MERTGSKSAQKGSDPKVIFSRTDINNGILLTEAIVLVARLFDCYSSMHLQWRQRKGCILAVVLKQSGRRWRLLREQIPVGFT